MKKNDVFTFTAPNGVKVTAVVLKSFMRHKDDTWKFSIENICYAQNRLFTYMQKGHSGFDTDWKETIDASYYGKVIVDYCILPDYDEMLKAEQQKFEDDCYEALSSIGDVEF